MAKRVIVDENAGRNTALWREFQRVLGDQPWEYVFLNEAHPGIPDVEILDKLLTPGTLLLTGDCVLHERATGSNEVKRVDFSQLAAQLLAEEVVCPE